MTPDYPGDSLVGPDWLADRMDDPGLRLFDLSDLPGYRDGHIPGARHFWWQDLIEIHNPVYGMLLGPDDRAELMREAGVAPDSTVVCYDRSGGVYASRLIWVLRYMGHTSAHLLVGGLQGWRENGGDLSNESPADYPAAGIGDIRDETINTNSGDIRNRLGEPGFVVLDTRTADELDETWRGKLRKGRIPGSHWLPRDQFLASGPVPSVISPTELTDRLADAGVDLDTTNELVVYGLHATLASLPWLALATLGGTHVRLYDGSWADWATREELPIEGIGGRG